MRKIWLISLLITFLVMSFVVHGFTISPEKYNAKEKKALPTVIHLFNGQETCSPRVNNARDSGILLHSTGEDGAFSGIWMHSIECQLIEGGTGDRLFNKFDERDCLICSGIKTTD